MQEMTTLPIQLGDVQVIGINRTSRELALNIKLDCKPQELVLISSKVEAKEKLEHAFRYLVNEGFIISSQSHRWNINVFAAAKI
jgi:hypothetical protein